MANELRWIGNFCICFKRHCINIKQEKWNHGVLCRKYVHMQCLLGHKTPVKYCLPRLGYQLTVSHSIWPITLVCTPQRIHTPIRSPDPVPLSQCLLYKCLLGVLIRIFAWTVLKDITKSFWIWNTKPSTKQEPVSVGSFGLIVLGFCILIVMEIALDSTGLKLFILFRKKVFFSHFSTHARRSRDRKMSTKIQTHAHQNAQIESRLELKSFNQLH